LPAVRHGAEGESIKGLCCLSPEKEETGVSRRIRAWELSVNDEMALDNLFRVDCPIFPAAPGSIEQVILAAQDIQNMTGMPVRLILDTLGPAVLVTQMKTPRGIWAHLSRVATPFGIIRAQR
jgi:hypothetical protein